MMYTADHALDIPNKNNKLIHIPAVLNVSRWQVYPAFQKAPFEMHSETALAL